jgi:hypothetical protein
LHNILSSRKTYHSLDLDGIRARRISLQALPLGDPAGSRIGHGNHTLEDGAGTVLDHVGAVSHLEKLVAVRTATADELGAGLDDGAHHAGAQTAERHICLLWWCVGFGVEEEEFDRVDVD